MASFTIDATEVVKGLRDAANLMEAGNESDATRKIALILRVLKEHQFQMRVQIVFDTTRTKEG